MLYLTNIDLNGNELQNAVVQCLATAPTSGSIGQIYYNTSDYCLYMYTGAAWVAVGSNLGYTTVDLADGTTAGLVKGGGDVTISSGVISVVDDSHNHIVSNIDGLSSTLSGIQSSIATNTSNISSLSNSVGAADGICPLDSDGLVSSAYLPSYVDDVVEGYLSSGVFYEDSSHTTAITAESDKIYVDLTDSKIYRYSGSTYVEISSSLALGETSSTAYRGDRGKIAYTHSQSAHAPTDAEANLLESVSVNGEVLTIDDDKNVDIAIPTALSDLEDDMGVMTSHPSVTVSSPTSTTSKTLSWGSSIGSYLMSITRDSYGHVTNYTLGTITMPANPVPSNVATYYEEENPALTVSGGSCTWTVQHGLDTKWPVYQVYDVDTGEAVMVDGVASGDTLTLTINSSSAISAGTYRVRVM